jgi:PTS system nitrogen regulatory IIA component
VTEGCEIEPVTKIEAFLDPANVLVDLKVLDKDRLLEDLSARAASALGLDADAIKQQVVAREGLGSTGLGDGIGLPHARLDGVTKPFGILARLKKPIEFDAIDGQLVDLVFLLLLPSATPDENLNALACIARKLRDPQALKRLRQAPDATVLFQEIVR